MRKRPLCFVCITLVLLMWLIYASGGLRRPSDVLFSKEQTRTIHGKIYQCEYKKNYLILYLKQTTLFADFPNQNVEKLNNVKLTCKNVEQDIQVGDLVCANGILEIIEGATNPGQFDAEEYYGSKRIRYTMWNPDVTVSERPKCSIIRGLWKLRCSLAENLDQILPNQKGALLKGMTLGDKTSIAEETTLAFRNAGLSHLLAISGLHLQMLGNVMYTGLRRAHVGLKAAAAFSAIFLLCYGVLTGNSVATVRALIMFLFGIGADVTGRTYDSFTGIALTAMIQIAGNPSNLSNSGFWLSFSAVAALMIFKEKRKLYHAILFYVFMAPVTLFYFYELPIFSIVINLLVVPTAGVVLVSGLLGAMGTYLSAFLGKVLAFPSVVLLHIYQLLCDINGKLPGHMLILGKPSFVQVLLYGGLLILMLFLFRRNAFRVRRIFVLLLIVPAIAILLYRGPNALKITMLDVGQGDALVIQNERKSTYLVDCGSSSEKDIGEYRLVPYLKHEGIRKIEGIFISHADTDHMNGIIQLLQLIKEEKVSLKIRKILIPDWKDITPFESMIDLANDMDIEVCRFKVGAAVQEENMILECIYPRYGDYGENTNGGSMVLRLEYEDFSMLFTGDLGQEEELELMEICEAVDVLKVGHHGSDSSSSKAFLDDISPRIGLISCGKDNSYGHPHKEVLVRLESVGTKVFRTDHAGAITIVTDGEKIDLKTYKQYNEP